MKKSIFFTVALLTLQNVFSQESKTEYSFYGQFMTDFGYNTGQVNPDYYDVMRPTQLPSFKNEYGTDGNVSFGVRQSRLGFKSTTPTKLGNLQTRFEFDLFGLGENAGQTAFHLLYAYVELGKFGIGHHWSLFSDIDGFPNALEYWGPSGMSLCKNVQFRFIPLNGATRLAFALERPGASADEGVYADRIELDDVKPYFNLPDLTAEFRKTGKWGYAELAGVVRKIEWIDLGTDQYNLSGKAVGWGFNFSTNLKITRKDLFRGQSVFGNGIENLMNDAPTDIGIENNFDDPVSPVKGVALPIAGFMTYLDHTWNNKFSSTIGFSNVSVRNSDGQADSAFKNGKFASLNLLYYPVENFTAGAELIWIKRENFNDGWSNSCTRIQISVRYSFAHQVFIK
jgi:hypothetical protein